MNPNVTLTKQELGNLNLSQALEQIRKSDVLVGITQAASSRNVYEIVKGRKVFRGSEEINNAELLYIHTNGSPARGIPARPVIEPAIAADGNRQEISRELGDAAAAYLAKEPQKALTYLRRAGLAGQNASKAWFTDRRNGWAPNKPATIRRKGSDRPLIDTGAMRRSITFVVRAAA